MKTGAATVGAAPHHTGTAGRVVNAQAAVYLAHATSKGYAFPDRALYLPQRWTHNRARCAAAGIPDDVEFATKPAPGHRMIQTALRSDVPCSWVAGDEVYGADPQLRAAVATAGVGSSWPWPAPTG